MTSLEAAAAGAETAPLAPAVVTDTQRKLVILCIHGFRQNGRQFKGRLAGLQKKLADVATFIFLDAPYVLPLWYKPTPEETQRPVQQQQRQDQHEGPQEQPASNPHHLAPRKQQQYNHMLKRPQELPAPKRAWLLSSELLAAQTELQTMFQEHQQLQQRRQQNVVVPCESSLEAPHTTPNPSATWQVAPADVATPEQHTLQCMGWPQSWRTIQQALTNNEQQIDGLLGFSQGSAVVAMVAALLQQQQQQQSSARSAAVASMVKFIILASGFISPAPEHQELLNQLCPLQIPSLHVYAAASFGSDRQIQQRLSDDLYDLCEPATRHRILHDGGHLIPCRREVINEIRTFLQQFT